MITPDLSVETALAQQTGGTMGAGMDEVGRGALAGPVAVGVAAVDMAVAEPLEGLRDSKKLTVLQRERMAVAIPTWATTAVGFAAADEIDAYGLSRSEEHTSELQSRGHLVCRLLLEKKK